MFKLATVSILIISLLYMSACAAKPANNVGFIEKPERLSESRKLPFHKVWVEPTVNFNSYTDILVAQVNVEYVFESSWVKEVRDNPKKSREVTEAINNLGKYAHSSIVNAFKEDPSKRFKLINDFAHDRGNVLLLEIALIEAVPSNTLRGALELIPHPGVKIFGKITNDSSIAFEGRLRDARTNQVIAAFADRETRDVRLIDTHQLSMFGAIESIIDDWSGQFVEIANKMPEERVEESFPLKLW